MIKEYKTIREIASPLMIVEHVEGVTYDELGEIELPSGEKRRCKVLEVEGDRAVVQTMRLIRENLPNDALLGRFGGSKFVAFMHAEDGRAVAAFGRAVEAAAAEHNAAHEGSYRLSITYGGVVLPIGESSFQSVSTAMQLVDKRLYEMNRSHGRGFRYGGGTSMSEPSPRND